VAKGRAIVAVATDVCGASGDWTSVEADVRRAAGVKGVTNEIEIKPTGRRDTGSAPQTVAPDMAILRALRQTDASVFSGLPR